jgi:FkbM family methyltransferase
MDLISSNNYNLENLVKVTTKKFGFDLFTTPENSWKYTQIVYEKMTALLIRQNSKGIKTFIDVGAHNGFFDVLVGLSNPNCKIIAFEPVPENIEVVKKNLEYHGLKSSLHNVAVSDHQGRLSFQVSSETDLSGFIANPDQPVLKNIEVDVVKLDQFLEQIADGPVLVKIDTEGSETKVLSGMKQLIEKIDDLRLIIEINPSCLEVNNSSPGLFLNELDKLGFDVFVVFDEEMKYIKYIPGSNWDEYMGERTYRNVFCVKKKHSLNICVFSHTSFLGGAEKCLLEVIDRLIAKHGAIFTIVLPAEGVFRNKIEELGGAVIIIENSWWCAKSLPTVKKVNELMSTSFENILESLPDLERISPDIFLTNTMVIPWGALSASLTNRPHIWWVHEFGQLDHNMEFFLSFQKSIDIIKESSNHVVVNSDAVQKTLFQDLGIEKCTVATYNISLAMPSNQDKKYFQYPTSTKLIIAGNITRKKGQDDAIHAIKLLINRQVDVELCIVGNISSPYAEGLKSLVKMEGLDDRIHFIDFVDNIRPLLEQADINLMCSEHEAFGRVTVEAMLLGLPVIGTNAGGTVELIDDGKNGLFYSSRDVNDLVNKISYFIETPEKIKEFGKYAQESIAKKLAANPADTTFFQLFSGLKNNKTNTKSPQLLQMALMLQSEIKRKFDRDVEERNIIIEHKDKIIQELNGQLQGITNSSVWRLATMPRRILKLFFPAGSFGYRSFLKLKGGDSKLRKDIELIIQSGLFDQEWYLAENPDVVKTGITPASHYLQFGGFEGRDPGKNFSSKYYLATYADVKNSKMNPLLHYLKFGKNEGRNIQQRL